METLWRLDQEDQISLMHILKNLDYDSEIPIDKNIFWITFYSYKGTHVDKPIDDLKNFVDAVLKRAGNSQVKILSVTVVFNKVRSIEQLFHVDYHADVENIFIPLIDLNSNNSTQFLEFDNIDEQQHMHSFLNSFRHLPSLEVIPNGICYKVAQICCPAFQVLHLKPGTIHRGITNRGKADRPMFCICFTKNFDVTMTESHFQKITQPRYDK